MLKKIEFNDSSKDSEDSIDLSFDNLNIEDPETNLESHILTETKYKEKVEINKRMKKHTTEKGYYSFKE